MGFQSEHTALVCWNHVFYVDVCVFSSMLLQYLESLLNQISKVLVLSLRVVNLITDIHFVISSVRLLFLNILKTGRICL